MVIEHFLIEESPKSTISAVFINGVFKFYILEDGENKVKVPGETRVDGGFYKAEPTKQGTIFQSIKEWAPDMRFAIVVLGFPRHSAIMYHPGNYTSNTRGCFLPGFIFSKYKDKARKGVHYIQDSRLAYRVLYEELNTIFDPVAFKFTEDVEVRIYRDNVSQLLSQRA